MHSNPNNNNLLLVRNSQQEMHSMDHELTSIVYIAGCSKCAENATHGGSKERLRRRPGMGLQKKVTFSESCKLRDGLHRNDYTVDEISACWYSRDEASEITRKCVRLLSKFIEGKAENYCIRGLEQMTPEAARQRENTREDAYVAVLGEQQRCRNLSKSDNEEAIARKYRQAAAAYCQQVASEIGRIDEMVARKISRKTRSS